MTRVLAVVPHFPTADESADGQANSLTQLVPVMAEMLDGPLEIIALRFGTQAPEERGANWRVHRVSPPEPLDDVFALYLPQHLRPALDTLTAHAVQAARRETEQVPVWCHGYETGAVVAALRKAGHHVVAVPHYSVGVETLHDLALGDDPTRARAFDSPWATRLGRTWPAPARAMGVRWASRVGRWGQQLPLPAAIRTQFAKLDLERQLIAHASRSGAVGPSFEAELNALYPCSEHRTESVIAGPPRRIEARAWPWSEEPARVRMLMVGRPTGQKGWDYAAEALSGLSRQALERIDLVLIGGLGCGDGPYSAYSQRVAADFEAIKGIRLRNLGACSHTETLAHMVSADLLLFPSVFEPLGLVLIEGLTHGCCVLASNAAGPSDILQAPWGQRVDFSVPQERVHQFRAGLQAFIGLDRGEIDRRKALASVAGQGLSWTSCAEVHLDALMSRGA